MSETRSRKANEDTANAVKEKALLCARLALEKKAYGLTILHLGVLSTIAEYFVVCSGKSVRQTRAISEHIQLQMKKARHRPLGVEGEAEGCWILLDYDDVVVHVFHEPTREYYALEKLWSDAPLLEDAELAEAEKKQNLKDAEDDVWEE
jgi:ribosome-associated protein